MPTPPNRGPQGRPTSWPVTGDFSRVDLRLDDPDEDVPEERDAEDISVPAPAPNRRSNGQGGDVAKVVGGGSATLVVLALIDKAFADTGISAADVAERLGPMLGALYNSYPVVGILVVVLFYLLRSYRRDQEEHKRRDYKLQRALLMFGRGIKSEVEGLRSDIMTFADRWALFESRVNDELQTTARSAGDRADRTDNTIDEMRRQLADLNTRLSRAEAVLGMEAPPASASTSQVGADVPTQPRRIRVPEKTHPVRGSR